MPPLRTDDALGPQHASIRWASGTTEFWMPGLPRGADHIGRTSKPTRRVWGDGRACGHICPILPMT